MSSSIPTTIRALVLQENHTAAVQEVAVPTLEDNEVLIKVRAVALNPTDWKHIRNWGTPGKISGCDFAGVVAQVGPNLATSLKVGDHVAGAVHGGYYTDRGAFAEYLKAESDLVWKIPPGTVTFEEASTYSVGAFTAVSALYQNLSLPLPSAPVQGTEWFFVYGGSTSVGQYAIQLANASGYKVVTVASPRNHELVKSLGAHAVFDYNSPTAINDIKAVTGDSIQYSLDTVSLEETQIFTRTVHTSSKSPLKSVIILPVSEKAKQVRSDVEVSNVLLYNALGKQWGGVHRPNIPADRAFLASHTYLVPALIGQGKLKANKIKSVEGGLDGLNGGLEYLEQGKVSAEKLVFTI